MSRFARTLVTAALPYANGPIHLGHLAGVYLPADVYVRYLRMRGHPVLFICGTDEHGVPITLAAEREGISPKALVDRNFLGIRDSFEQLGIRFDNFSQTSRPIHHQVSSAFFLDLHHQGVLKEGLTKQFFSERAGRFLPDRYVEGTCPYCGSTRARGDQCEACGSQMEPEKLGSPRSVVDDTPLTLRETKHWFLPMGKMQPQLEAWIGSKTDWRENVVNYCNGWFAQGLGDRAVTRDLDWGVPVPLPGHEGKVLYVWFDAPIGYISATQEWAAMRGEPEAWRLWWQDAHTRLLHFIGKDNIVFHALLFPCMLMAHSEPFILPDNVPANEFLNLEGQKLSTSRGYAVWLPEYLQRFPPDSLRYCLARNLPETRDTNFSWDDFQARHNGELADVLGNFVNRTITFVMRYFDGRVPAKGTLGQRDQLALDAIARAARSAGQQLEAFQIRSAAETIMLLGKEANRYFDEAAPWATRKTDPAACATSLYVCCQFLRAQVGLWASFLPFTMQKLWTALGVEGELALDGWPLRSGVTARSGAGARGEAPEETREGAREEVQAEARNEAQAEARAEAQAASDELVELPAGHPLTSPGILFAKLEDAAIAVEKERLQRLQGRVQG